MRRIFDRNVIYLFIIENNLYASRARMSLVDYLTHRFFALTCALFVILPLHVLSIRTTVVLVSLRVLPLFARSHFVFTVRRDMRFGPTHETFSCLLCKLRSILIIFLVVTILTSFLLIVCIV